MRRPSARLGIRPALEMLEDRLTPSTVYTVDDNGSANFHTIQAAVNAAHAGDTIKVYPGTYTEQVTIGSGKDRLTLTTIQDPDATIQSPGFAAPASPADVDAAYVVRVSGSKNVTINDFNINGAANTQYGIKVDSGASVTITNNNITNISAAAFGGLGGGAGIDIGEAGASGGSAIICSNRVSGYGKVGIVIDGAQAKAAVAYNDVIGLGGFSSFTQYGIQVSNGASGDLYANSVSSNSFGAQAAAGILVFNASNQVDVEGNFTYANEYGIFVFGSNQVDVEGNVSYGNNNDGIQLQGTNNSSVIANISAYNGGDGISVYGSVDNDPNSATNNTVADNLIYGNAGNGVTVQDTAGTKVVDNIIIDNDGSGVSLTDAKGGQVSFNFIDQDDADPAIAIDNSSAHITHNVIV